MIILYNTLYMKNLIGYLTQKLHNLNVNTRVTQELYGFIPKTLISILVLALIFVGIFWFKVENQWILSTWLALILIVSAIRYVDYQHYQKDTKKNALKWYYSFHNKLFYTWFFGRSPLYCSSLSWTMLTKLSSFFFSLALPQGLQVLSIILEQ